MSQETNKSPARFSLEVSELLHCAGWFEGRDTSGVIDLPSELENEMFPAAERILREFNGLHIGAIGRGINMARSDVEIDPALVAQILPELRAIADKLGVKLFPLGQFTNGHFCLLVDERGRVYLLNDEPVRWAPTFDRALELLLLGKKPDQKELESAWDETQRGVTK